jgi:hypothetical protein
MGTFETSTPNTMAELRRNHISHVVLGDLGTTPWLESAMRRVVADSASAFSVVYRDSVFTMLALLPAAATPEQTSAVSAAHRRRRRLVNVFRPVSCRRHGQRRSDREGSPASMTFSEVGASVRIAR